MAIQEPGDQLRQLRLRGPFDLAQQLLGALVDAVAEADDESVYISVTEIAGADRIGNSMRAAAHGAARGCKSEPGR